MLKPTSIRAIVLLLAVCLALELTGLGIVFPILARKLSATGAGIETLGLSSIAFSIASLLAAPLLGSLADILGRRKVVLISFAAYVLAFMGYYLAASGKQFIGVRVFAGALTAGLMPAALGMISDISPENERGRWIGIMSGGSSVGLIFGPYLGGWLYDHWGLAMPFITAALLSGLALLVAYTLLPETHYQRLARQHTTIQNASASNSTKSQIQPMLLNWRNTSVPVFSLIGLLTISFLAFFSWAFIEPVLPFYVYDNLGWTSARFGLSLSGYAVMLVIGETLLGQLSDKYGRKLVIWLGLMIHSAQHIALVSTNSFALITLGITVAGLGEALFSPALNAKLLDISPEQYRGRFIGLRNAANSLGGLVGPAMAVGVAGLVPAVSIFMIAGGVLLASAFLVLVTMREARLEGSTTRPWQSSIDLS